MTPWGLRPIARGALDAGFRIYGQELFRLGNAIGGIAGAADDVARGGAGIADDLVPGAPNIAGAADDVARGAGIADDLVPGAPNSVPHKNSLDYVVDTHVYRVRGPNGTHKIGESAQGVRVGDGASIRAEQQVRKLNREIGPGHSSDIRKTFPDKRSAREYETNLIERFRRMFGDDALPGNKTNR